MILIGDKMRRYHNPPRWLQNETQLEIFSNGVTQKQQVFWIARQHKKTGEPIEDIIPIVKKFEKYRQSKNVTGKDADINAYKNVGDLNRVITYIEMPEWKKGLDFKAEVDTLGTFGEWTILFPKTIRGSMACDPNDITSWCTVRKS